MDGVSRANMNIRKEITTSNEENSRMENKINTL